MKNSKNEIAFFIAIVCTLSINWVARLSRIMDHPNVSHALIIPQGIAVLISILLVFFVAREAYSARRK